MNASAVGSDVYNHPICDRCWFARHPRQTPVRVSEPERARCCWCGDPIKSGIYERDDPWDLPKHTVHAS